MDEDTINKLYQIIIKVVALLEREIDLDSEGLKATKDITNIIYKVLNVIEQLDKLNNQNNKCQDISDQDKQIIEQFLKKCCNR